MRPYVYVAFDVVFAAVYVWISRTLIPTSDGSFELLSLGLAAAALAMGVGTLIRRRWAWWVGVVGCGALLLGATLILVGLAMSAAFLAGVYGAFGKGAAALTVIAIALAVELYALLPLFQLGYLLSPSGRQRAGS
jgi:hypothetical protein